MIQAKHAHRPFLSAAILLLLLTLCCSPARAQRIDSSALNRAPYPNQLFVRLHFPDSTYELSRVFDRVALNYPPVNIVTFFYRSCGTVHERPVRDTVVPVYVYPPYKLHLWLVRDSNTANPDCVLVPQTENVDSVFYNTEATGVALPEARREVLTVFPNPSTGLLHISAPPGGELLVTDALGRLLRRQLYPGGQEPMDIRALAPGLYYIHYYRDGQRVQSLPFSRLP